MFVCSVAVKRISFQYGCMLKFHSEMKTHVKMQLTVFVPVMLLDFMPGGGEGVLAQSLCVEG